MALRGKPTPPGLKQSGPRITSNVYVAEVAKIVQQTVAADTAALDAQIASLQSQLAQAQADLAQAQAALAIAQAQNAADAVTIATLQAQVTSLQSQVTSLQSQVTTLTAQVASLQAQLSKIFKVIIIDTFASDAGGIYVPPVYDNLTVNFTTYVRLNPYIINTYASTGGGYP